MGRRSDTKDPRRSRERALKILFQADVRGTTPGETLRQLVDDDRARVMLDDGDDEVDGFTRALVGGVGEHLEEIDGLIARYARRWQISRMPVVDRTVLRLATYELLYEVTPAAVAIDEAVELAKSLSTDDSGRYVNGVLESIRKDVTA